MHISEKVAAELNTQGWSEVRGGFEKLLAGRAMCGTVSDGSRVVRLQMDATGRWLERIDQGLGTVERDVDLRCYNDVAKAIVAVLA